MFAFGGGGGGAALPASHRALLRSQAGPRFGAWPTAIPSEVATTLSSDAMRVPYAGDCACPCPSLWDAAARRQAVADRVGRFGDHPRTGLLARRAKVVERVWIRVAREAVGSEGQVVPQQWLAHTTAPGVAPGDRRRLHMLVYGATPTGQALCCDATLVSPLTRTTAAMQCRRRRGSTPTAP